MVGLAIKFAFMSDMVGWAECTATMGTTKA
jgi:hypothetical protein